jgi:hypothetical protein
VAPAFSNNGMNKDENHPPSAVALLIRAGAATAQTNQKAPGGNLPTGQGPCAISSETMRSAVTNNDGRLSKSEFDAACAKKLFDQQQQKN